MKKVVILVILCILAALLAGCTSSENTERPGPEMTMPPTPGGEALPGNMTRPSDNMNQTMSKERGFPPEGMNMTPGGSSQPPEAGVGGVGEQFRPPDKMMNGIPPAPGMGQDGMQPPAPQGTYREYY